MEQYLQFTNTTKEQMLERIKPDAIAKIKTGLVLEAVAEAEKIVASDEDFDAEVQDMAVSYQMEADKIKEILGGAEKDSVMKNIAARKALDFIVSNCKEV